MAAESVLSLLQPSRAPRIDVNVPVLIIGAGFSGLGMAIKLKAAGVTNFEVLERADEVGGTWRDNHYPGAACDVASHLYSFSFEPNPEWTRAFGQQPEIQAYIQACARKHDLYRHIRFGCAVVSARFDDDTGFWTVQTAGGETCQARVLISAVGALSNPTYPDIPGLAEFAGKFMHTAEWDDDYDLRGKRVAVIGSGASAIQVVPEIGRQAAAMTVFQRTPCWVMPKPDRAIPPAERAAYRASPFKLTKRRLRIYWMSELFAPFIISNRRFFKRQAERVARAHMAGQVADPELRERLTPDYPIGCKRVLISNDWYPAICADNAELVTAAPARVTRNGVVTADGREIAVDAIVCATGFRVPSEAAPFPVTGLDGRDLSRCWADGAEAYKGVAVAGFPNLFFLMGPNTGPSHTSVLAFTEIQMAYIARAIRHLAQRKRKWLMVRESVQRRFNRGIQKRMRHTSWTAGCQSWYLTRSGKNTTLYPGFNWEYRMRLWWFSPRDYESAPQTEAAEAYFPVGSE